MPYQLPCSSCGELKSVTSKSRPAGELVCQPCRAKRRADAEAALVAECAQQCQRLCHLRPADR
jgi:hypothetical protein